MIGAVIIATDSASGGNGNGHGGGKQLALISPTYVLESAIKPFLKVSLKPVILVLGKDYHRILNVLKTPREVKVVIHRRPERGFPSAVSVGLQSLPSEIEGAVIARGDHVLESRTLEKLIRYFEEESAKSRGGRKIVVPLYHGKRGFPWVIATSLKKEISRFEEDLTLGSFLKAYKKEVLTVPVEGLET